MPFSFASGVIIEDDVKDQHQETLICITTGLTSRNVIIGTLNVKRVKCHEFKR